MHPIVFQSGAFQLGSYGVLLVAAAFAALFLAAFLGKRDHIAPKRLIDVGVITLFSGIFGAKLLGVLVILWSGGRVGLDEIRNAGAVHGGLLGGLLAIYWLTRKGNPPLRALGDAYAPGFAIGQAIGRVGCFAAGCCFGRDTDGPFGVSFSDPEATRLGGAPLFEPLHPVQLYDAGAHVVLALVLAILHRRGIVRYRLAALYLMGEGVLRFSMESFRGDLGRGVWFLGLSTGRVTSILLFSLGLLLLLRDRAAPDKVGIIPPTA